jgi:glucose/arabinose dehydrogenase
VAVENTTTKRWWNGTSFSATSQTFVTASGTTSWKLALAVKYLTSCDSYGVIAQATDSLGNVDTSSTVTFTYNSGSHV